MKKAYKELVTVIEEKAITDEQFLNLCLDLIDIYRADCEDLERRMNTGLSVPKGHKAVYYATYKDGIVQELRYEHLRVE